MPRKARPESRTGYYHIIFRGVNRLSIFLDDEDRRIMLEAMGRFAPEAGVGIAAYCLMSNHVHLLLRVPEEGAAAMFVKKIASSYVFHFNHKYGRIGHLFQERFKSEAVDDERYLLTVFRYILRNPEKAGICPTQDFPWSSFRELAGEAGICQMQPLLDAAGGRAALVKFVLLPNDDKCLEADEGRRLSDEEALAVVREVAGSRLGLLPNLPIRDRNSLLLQMSRRGVSVPQLVRLTGVSRNVAFHAVKSG